MDKKSNLNNVIKSLIKSVSRLKSEVESLISPAENASESVIKLIDNRDENSKSDYEKEVLKIKELMVQTQKFYELKSRLSLNVTDVSQTEEIQNISKSFEETLPVLEQLGVDASDFAKIFNSAFDKVLTKSQSFSDSMKSLFDDLRKYFIKTLAQTMTSAIFNQAAGNNFISAFANSAGNSGFSVSGIVRSFLGIFSGITSHHTGGVIPSGASYSLPGTQEYLALLKGGERVLSPSENASFSKDENRKNKLVVNNFNIKAWDSKDVQQYLLENKNLLASITAENIKYNNANLRYMTGGA